MANAERVPDNVVGFPVRKNCRSKSMSDYKNCGRSLAAVQRELVEDRAIERVKVRRSRTLAEAEARAKKGGEI